SGFWEHGIGFPLIPDNALNGFDSVQNIPDFCVGGPILLLGSPSLDRSAAIGPTDQSKGAVERLGQMFGKKEAGPYASQKKAATFRLTQPAFRRHPSRQQNTVSLP